MSKKQKLSLHAAILMNINIMAGAGLFINSVILTKNTGIAGSFLYLILGICMFPLIYAIAKLVKKYPSGGFYTFSSHLSPLLGFISCWSYFFGKLASTSLILYASSLFIKALFPTLLQTWDPINLSLMTLSFFVYLNLCNIKTGVFIQKIFFCGKSLPILFVICTGLYYFDFSHIANAPIITNNIITTIPLVLYCLAGFEATCSISRKIENPEINGPKAIFYSFFIIIIVYTIFQLLVSLMLLPHLDSISSYKSLFNITTKTLLLPESITNNITSILNLLIGISTLGGAYSILFSNSWNLLTLAEHHHTFFSNQISKLNQHNMPTSAIIIEGIACALFLIVSKGNQIPLQQTAVIGVTIAYTISIISLIRSELQEQVTFSTILAFITCLGFIASCSFSVLSEGLSSLILFMIILSFGIFMFIATSKKADPFYK